MKKFRKSFIARWITAVLIVCIMVNFLDIGFLMTVKAEGSGISENTGPEQAENVEAIAAEPAEPEAAESEMPEQETETAEQTGPEEPEAEIPEAPVEEESETEAANLEMPETEIPGQEETDRETEAGEVPDTQVSEPEEPEDEEAPEEVLQDIELTARADGLEFILKAAADNITSAEEDLRLAVEPMKAENEKTAWEKVEKILEEGWTLQQLEGYKLKLFDGNKEIKIADGRKAELTVKETEELKNLKAQETEESEVSEDAQLDLYDFNETEPRNLTHPKTGEILENEKKVLEEDELLKADIENTGDFALVYAEEEEEEKEPEASEESDSEIKLTAEVNGVEITVTAPEEAFPGDGELSLLAEEITDERLEKAKEMILEKMLTTDHDFTAYRLFDITPLMDGKEIQPEKPVKVSFKNLQLEQDDGTKVDVFSELEKNLEKEETFKEKEETEAAEKVGFYHFTGEEAVEEMNPVAEEGEVVVEVEHFSWHFMGTEVDSGETATWTYTDEEGEYTLEYILGNYNVFTHNMYIGSHVVGPVVIGGESIMTGNFGGLTPDPITHIAPPYPHKVPSYWKGDGKRAIGNGEYNDAFPEIVTDNSPAIPAYVGEVNRGSGITYTPHYYTDNYVNFDEAFGGDYYANAIGLDALKYMNYVGYDLTGHKIDKFVISKEAIQEAVNGGDGYKYVETTRGAYTIYNTAGKVHVAVKMGYNFNFESFQNVESFIYDYKNIQELEKTMTIISTNDHEEVNFPKIYKMIANDAFGTGNVFDSIEAGYPFTVLYLLPYADRVYVGCTPGEEAGKEPDHVFINEEAVKPNGSTLTGHLVAPQADIVLRGGNYNGSVIANRVDAKGTEGHMWPFVKSNFKGDLQLSLKKTLDGRLPGENKFNFTAVMKVVDSDWHDITTSEPITVRASNDAAGNMNFIFPGLESGNYIVTISEDDLTANQSEEFHKTDVTYEVRVTITADESGMMVPAIQWYRIEADGTRAEINDPETEAVFNNTSKRALKVHKVWQDENGDAVSGTGSVKVNLYQTTEYESGYKVTFKIYSHEHSAAPTTEGSKLIGESSDIVRAGGSVAFDIENMHSNGLFITAGIFEIIQDGQSVKAKYIGDKLSGAGPLYFANAKGILENIQKDTVVSIYYTAMNGGPKPENVTMDMFQCAVTSDDWAMPSFDLTGTPFKTAEISEDHAWSYVFEDLPEFDESDPPKPYYYKVVEELPGGYKAEYDENQINNGDAETTIINRKTAGADLKLIKKDSTKPNGPGLLGAEFTLKKDDTELWFTGGNGVYQYQEAEQDGTTKTLVTGKDGFWKITGLPFGTYVLEEIKAPDGYDKELRKVTIKIDSDGCTWKYENGTEETLNKDGNLWWFTFLNHPGAELPETGGTGTNRFITEGILCVEISLMMMFYEISRRRKEERNRRNGCK